MRFQSAMAAMATNQNHVAQFAEKMGWDKERAEATLQAYGTGKYFPSKIELQAMGVSESLYWAYMVALNAYHIDAIIAAGLGKKLYEILQKATIEKWRVGNAMPSQRSKGKIEIEFGVDLHAVPSECIYTYAQTKQVFHVDLRRNRLTIDNRIYVLAQVSPDAYVVRLESVNEIQAFHSVVAEHGLETEDNGDFKRAVIPASDTRIYYVKS